MGSRFRNPITVQGVESDDGRIFNLFEFRELPLAVRWVPADTWGHDGAQSVGVLEKVWQEGELWWGEGEYLDDEGDNGIEVARTAAKLASKGAQFFSADPGGKIEYHWVILDANGEEVDPKDVSRAYDDIYWGDDDDGKLKEWLSSLRELIVFDFYEVGAISQLDIPCWPQCRIAIVEAEGDQAAAGGRVPLRAVDRSTDEAKRARVLLRRLAAGPATKPTAWYEKQNLDRYTPMSISPEGQITGHIAGWNACHRGFQQKCVKPQYQTTFDDFHTGWTHLDNGEKLRTGVVTHIEGHMRTAEDYDRLASDPMAQLGTARLYADKWGIQVSGSVHPDVSPEQCARSEAGAPSGDWRGPKGGERLHGIAMVNTPGYTAMYEAGGGQVRLVAAIPPPAPGNMDLTVGDAFWQAPSEVITQACACEATRTRPEATTDQPTPDGDQAAHEGDCGCGGTEGECHCHDADQARLSPAELVDLANLDTWRRLQRANREPAATGS